MNKYIAFFKGMTLMVIPLITSSCHYKITSPIMYKHGSSFAAESATTIWAINLIIVIGVIFISKEEYNREKIKERK